MQDAHEEFSASLLDGKATVYAQSLNAQPLKRAQQLDTDYLLKLEPDQLNLIGDAARLETQASG